MILTLDVFLKICAGFTAVCVAGGWLIKIIKAAKKPADDVNDKLNNDAKRIKALEDEMAYMTDATSLVLKSVLAMLGHMRTNNNTGALSKVETEVQNFLIER